MCVGEREDLSICESLLEREYERKRERGYEREIVYLVLE